MTGEAGQKAEEGLKEPLLEESSREETSRMVDSPSPVEDMQSKGGGRRDGWDWERERVIEQL